MKHEKAQLALEFLKHFYLSDMDEKLKEQAKKVLLEYLTRPRKGT